MKVIAIFVVFITICATVVAIPIDPEESALISDESVPHEPETISSTESMLGSNNPMTSQQELFTLIASLF